MGLRLPPHPGKLTERAFQAQVVRLARLLGWVEYHTHDSRRSRGGFPDLVLMRRRPTKSDNRVVVAELKVGDNVVTPEQRAWLDAFAAAGVPAHEWRPEDWDVIQETLT